MKTKSWLIFCIACLLGFSIYQQNKIQSLQSNLSELSSAEARSSGPKLENSHTAENPSHQKKWAEKLSDNSSDCDIHVEQHGFETVELIHQVQKGIDRKIANKYGILLKVLDISGEEKSQLASLIASSESHKLMYELVGFHEGGRSAVITEGEQAHINDLDSEIHTLLGEENYELYDGFRSFGSKTKSFVHEFKRNLQNSGVLNLSESQERELNVLLVNAKSGDFSDKYGSIEQELSIDMQNLNNDTGEDLLALKQKILIERVSREAEQILMSDQLEEFKQQGIWDYLL